MEISQKRNKLKKTLIIAMAAAMIPSVVAPMTAKAAPTVKKNVEYKYSAGLATGYNSTFAATKVG